jgi:hypothetical protein
MKYGPLLAVLAAVLVGAALTHALRPARPPQPEHAAPGAVATATADPGNSIVPPMELASHRGETGGHEEPDALEIERQRDEAMRRQEKTFEEEALDSAWSAKQTAEVHKALSATTMAQYGATAPSSASVECHSRTCRIVAAYHDQDQSELGQYAIVSGIGNALTDTSSYVLTQPDGSQTIVMYAKAIPAPPKGHH